MKLREPIATFSLAYLVSQYPAVSHTFIMREIQALRQQNIQIEVASINEPTILESQATENEKKEFSSTFYVKQQGVLKAFFTAFKTILLHPIGFFKGLLYALQLAKTDLKKIIYNLFYFVEAILVGCWMKNHQLKHLHVHFANPAATVGVLLTKIFPFTLSLTVHGPDEFYDVKENYLKEKIDNASFICCISFYAKSQLMKFSNTQQWNKFKIIPLGVDLQHFFPTTFRLRPSRFEILCVGRLVASKGQFVLIKAVDSLIRKGLSISLKLVGDGPDHTILKNYVELLSLENAISFEGAVNQERIRDYYAKADLFVLASFAEGIPVVLMEAMAMEIPCIASFINGIPELIRDHIDGCLCPPSDEETLAATIEYLIHHPQERQTLAKAGRLRILEKYNLEINIELLKQTFEFHLKGIGKRI